MLTWSRNCVTLVCCLMVLWSPVAQAGRILPAGTKVDIAETPDEYATTLYLEVDAYLVDREELQRFATLSWMVKTCDQRLVECHALLLDAPPKPRPRWWQKRPVVAGFVLSSLVAGAVLGVALVD